MKTRVLSLAVAGIMTIQVTAYAAPSRVDGIGDQAIAAAKTDLAQLKEQISAFDQALAQTEEDIVKKDKKGGISNGLAIGAGALGLAVGALTIVVSKKEILPGNPSSVSWGVLLIPATIALTVISSSAGLTSTALKSPAKVDDAKKAIESTEKAIANMETQKLSEQESQLIATLKSNLQETKSALASYQQNGDDVSRNRMISHAAQLGGIVLGVASLVLSINDGYKYNLPAGGQYVLGAGMLLGSASALGGNLATIITGSQSYRANEVLKEIRETREALKQINSQL